MRPTLADLTAGLRASRESVHPSIQAFPPVDWSQVARDLSLDSRAEQAGALEKPASDATGPDSVEHACLAEVERRASKAHEDYRSQLALYDARIERAMVSSHGRVDIEAAGQAALADFVALAVDDLEHFHLITREVQGRQAEYDQFRRANGLTRLPKIVSLREQLFRSIILAIFILIESLLNGLMFAKGSEGGLIGGATQALMFSLLNVGTAVLFALYGLPQLTHVVTARKVLGTALLVLYVTAALLLNLFIAHFRDAFIAHAGQVDMTPLWSHLASHPLALSDAQSWVLCALGIGLNLLALIDATGLEDLYWGYGRVGRMHEKAITEFAETKSACLASLMQRRDSAIEEMSSVIKELQAAEADAQLAMQGRVRLNRDFATYLSHLDSGYQGLILRYREANERARKTAPPAYFRSALQKPASPTLQVPALPDPPRFDMQERNLAIARVEHYIKAINDEYALRVRAYKTLQDVTAEVVSHAAA